MLDWDGFAASRSVARRRSVAAAELGQPLGTRRRRPPGLADDPGVDPAGVLDRDGRRRTGPRRGRSPRCCGSRPSSSPGAGGRRRRRPRAEQPVEIGRVQPFDDVGEANRASPFDPCQQVDDADRSERIAGLGDRRWVDPRVRQAGRRRAQRRETDGGDGGIDHGVGHLRLVHWGLPKAYHQRSRGTIPAQGRPAGGMAPGVSRLRAGAEERATQIDATRMHHSSRVLVGRRTRRAGCGQDPGGRPDRCIRFASTEEGGPDGRAERSRIDVDAHRPAWRAARWRRPRANEPSSTQHALATLVGHASVAGPCVRPRSAVDRQAVSATRARCQRWTTIRSRPNRPPIPGHPTRTRSPKDPPRPGDLRRPVVDAGWRSVDWPRVWRSC